MSSYDPMERALLSSRQVILESTPGDKGIIRNLFKSMKYPTNILIRGVSFTIEYVQTNREVEKEYRDDNHIGQIDYEDKIIRIFVSKVNLNNFEVLVHEILHGIFDRVQTLKFMLKVDALEPFVDTMANELVDILLSNNFITLPEVPSVTKRINEAKNDHV